MSKKYSKRLEVDYREYINILCLCILTDKGNPHLTRIAKLISNRCEELEAPHTSTDVNTGIKSSAAGNHSKVENLVVKMDADPLLNRYKSWKRVTTRYIAESDLQSLEIVKDVYVYRRYNVAGSAFRHHVSERTAYRLIENWFKGFKDAIWDDAYKK